MPHRDRSTLALALAAALAAALAVGVVGAPNAAAQCTDGLFGDVNDDGAADVLDVQCLVVALVASLVGQPGPACLPDPDAGDLNCSETTDVVDALLSISASIALPLPVEVDGNDNGCPDACEPPPGTTCDGFCGEEVPGAGCFCDAECASFGDCCTDFCDFCPAENIELCSAPDSCVGLCGAQAESSCWCDDVCFGFGDCCEDVCDACFLDFPEECGFTGCGDGVCDPESETLESCPEDCTPIVTSCEGICGEEATDCFCDDTCFVFGDCCEDICTFCGDVFAEDCGPPIGGPDSCEGACGSVVDNCYCDETCFALGDCCADVCTECAADYPDSCTPDPTCGDGICAGGESENAFSCPVDCADPPAATCEGICGSVAPDGSCSCDPSCFELDDCCTDYCDYCAESAPAECEVSACGDGICDAPGGESTATCPEDCPALCPGDGGACDGINLTPGCDDVTCCETVCGADSFCCTIEWDLTCVNTAAELCDAGEGGEGEGGEGEGGEGEPTGLCDGFCGEQAPSGCYCDAVCFSYADCCDDMCEFCAAEAPAACAP